MVSICFKDVLRCVNPEFRHASWPNNSSHLPQAIMADVADEQPSRRVRHAFLALNLRLLWEILGKSKEPLGNYPIPQKVGIIYPLVN